MEYLKNFKIFESRSHHPMRAFWLHNGNEEMVGILHDSIAIPLSNFLDAELDPDGDDMYGYSQELIDKNGGDVWFDGNEFTIQQGSPDSLTEIAIPIRARDLFKHPNKFTKLEEDYKTGPWIDLIDAISKIYPHINMPSPGWTRVS